MNPFNPGCVARGYEPKEDNTYDAYFFVEGGNQGIIPVSIGGDEKQVLDLVTVLTKSIHDNGYPKKLIGMVRTLFSEPDGHNETCALGLLASCGSTAFIKADHTVTGKSLCIVRSSQEKVTCALFITLLVALTHTGYASDDIMEAVQKGEE